MRCIISSFRRAQHQISFFFAKSHRNQLSPCHKHAHTHTLTWSGACRGALLQDRAHNAYHSDLNSGTADNFSSSWGSIKTHLRMCPPANFTLGCHAVQNRAFFTCVFDYCTGVVVLLTGPQEPNETFLPSPSAISSPQDWLICTGEVDVDMRGTGWNMCLHIWQEELLGARVTGL